MYYVNKNTGEFSPVDKKGFQPVFDDNTLPRYYLTGEYGDISNRSHMHLIVFFQKKFVQLICFSFVTFYGLLVK